MIVIRRLVLVVLSCREISYNVEEDTLFPFQPFFCLVGERQLRCESFLWKINSFSSFFLNIFLLKGCPSASGSFF